MYDVLILPGVCGCFYDCDSETQQAYGGEYDSYEECYDACVGSGIEPQYISPKGYCGAIAAD
jgi:hypothetical protein